MNAAEVPDELADKVSEAICLLGAEEYSDPDLVARIALAAVLPEIQAQAVASERAKRLRAERALKEMKRAMRSLADTWDRASEGAALFADILRREVRDAALLTTTTKEPKK